MLKNKRLDQLTKSVRHSVKEQIIILDIYTNYFNR